MPSPIESTYTVVWSIDNSLLKNTSIQDFVNENLSYFEKKLGYKMRISSEILSFNLSNHYFKEYIKDSVVLLADAAHSIHPLAGQGVNLGFADADIFCKKVENAHRLGFSLNEPTFLSKYSIERKALNLFMLKSMDLLLESFKVRNVYFNFLRGVGLKSLNKSKMIKAFFIKRASG
jgi:2-octaprenylphenol hydroxylase